LTNSNGGALSSFTYSAGCDDFCFVLPATELCSLSGRQSDTILSRGGGIQFELTATRNWAIWVIPFYGYITGHFSLNASSSDGTKVWLQSDAVSNGGSLHDAVSVGSHILLGARFNLMKELSLLRPIDDIDPFFFLVRTEFKSCILLDQVYHGDGSTNYVNV